MSKRKPKWRGVLASCSPDAIRITRAMVSGWLDNCEAGKVIVRLMGKPRASDAAMELIDDGMAYFEIDDSDAETLTYTFVCDLPDLHRGTIH